MPPYKPVIITTTAADREEAQRIGAALLEKKPPPLRAIRNLLEPYGMAGGNAHRWRNPPHHQIRPLPLCRRRKNHPRPAQL